MILWKLFLMENYNRYKETEHVVFAENIGVVNWLFQFLTVGLIVNAEFRYEKNLYNVDLSRGKLKN